MSPRLVKSNEVELFDSKVDHFSTGRIDDLELYSLKRSWKVRSFLLIYQYFRSHTIRQFRDGEHDGHIGKGSLLRSTFSSRKDHLQCVLCDFGQLHSENQKVLILMINDHEVCITQAKLSKAKVCGYSWFSWLKIMYARILK